MLEKKKLLYPKKNIYTTSLEKKEKNAYFQKMLSSFFKNESHPCLGAHSVMNTNTYTFGIFDKLGERESAVQTCKTIYKFLKERPLDHYPKLYSFFAFFEMSNFNSELEFEEYLWKHLNYVHEYDKKHHAWDSNVSSDPNNPNFSFSIGGKAFYIVGLHPNSSRKARRFPVVLLVFNLHDQFELLREKGKFNKLKEAIRARDVKLNGSMNPMMNDFGLESEVKQYSGRNVDKDWKCPFSK